MGMAWSRQQGDAARAAAWEHTKRCREQRRLMREAVRMRRQLAASHAGYLKSLGRAASTLTKFALGEPLPVSDHTPPAVLVHRPLAVPSTPPPLLRSIQENQRERELDGAAVVAEAPAPSAAARTEGATVGGEELRMAVRHRSLAEVAAGLEEFFLKASDAGDKVSDILEASNADYKAHGLGEEAVQGGQGEGAAADQSRQEADGAPGPGVQQEDQRGHPEAQGRVGQGARAAQLGVRGRARDLHGHLRAPGRPARAPGAGALPRHARHVEGDAPAPRGAGPDRAAAARAQQPDVHGPDDGHPARRHEGARGRHVGLVRRPGSPGQAPALLRRGPARLAQADTGADRRRRRRGLLLPCRRGANRIRGPVEAGAGPRALRRGAQVDQELRRRHPRALRAPGRRAPGGAPGRAVHPRAGSQVPDAAAGGEELLRLVRAGAGGVVAVEPGEALDGGRQAGAPRAERGGAAQGGDRRVPEEARGRDEEARQGHRRHQVLGGHRRAGDAAGGVPGHGHLLGVACHRSRGCVQTWQRCALVTYYILKRMERLK